MGKTLRVRIGQRWFTVEVEDLDSRPIRAVVDGVPVEVEWDAASGDQREQEATADRSGPEAEGAVGEGPPQTGPAVAPAPQAVETVAVRTPMPGLIVSVSVAEGDVVSPGDEVCVLEAMKMQQRLRADVGGKVVRVLVSSGQQVTEGTAIVEVAPQ